MENLKNTDWNEQLRRLDEKHAMNVANLQQLLSEEQERYVADRCRLTEEKTKSETVGTIREQINKSNLKKT